MDSSMFTFGQRVGVILIIQAFAISLVAVVGLLVAIAYSAVTVSAGAKRYWTTGTHLHYYFLSLILSEIIQAIGGLLSIKWVVKGMVEEGTLCMVQGALKNMGDVGTALATLAITINTFLIIVFKWTPPESPTIALTVLALIWTFIILVVAIEASIHRTTYYGNTGDWCWITSSYPVQRIALEYLWMWLAAFTHILLYALIALVIEGVVVFSGWKMIIPTKSERVHLRLRGGKASNAYAVQMLFYPAVYTLTVAPIAITRWVEFVKHTAVPFWALVLTDCLFALSGLFNVVLFALTRPNLVPQRRNKPPRAITFSGSGSEPGPPNPTGGHRDGAHMLTPNEEWAVAPRTSPVSPLNKTPADAAFPSRHHHAYLASSNRSAMGRSSSGSFAYDSTVAKDSQGHEVVYDLRSPIQAETPAVDHAM